MIELSASLVLATTGLIALAVGAEALVFGASWLSRVLRIPAAIVGLTIVAFATSVPELCVSLIAINQGSPDIAVGNVFGSNVFNTLVVIGAGAWLVGRKRDGRGNSLQVNRSVFRRELVECTLLTAACTAFLFWNSQDGLPSFPTFLGILMVAALLGYLLRLFREGKRMDSDPDGEELEPSVGPLNWGVLLLVASLIGLFVFPTTFDFEAFQTTTKLVVYSGITLGLLVAIRILTPHTLPTGPRLLSPAILVGLGLGALIGGSSLLVVGAQSTAQLLGISDAVVALVGIALGTSAPELATTVAAVRRNDVDMAVGNAIGSNMFNLLAVLGGVALYNGILNPFENLGPLNPRLPYDALAATAALGIVYFAAKKPPHELSKTAGIVMVVAWILYLFTMAWEPEVVASVTLP
ncbi:MAG: sodium:calcium antiporter [Myxococcota bacterium]|nr:sodium:calcium antiporter [Myxococcota bacterium]